MMNKNNERGLQDSSNVIKGGDGHEKALNGDEIRPGLTYLPNLLFDLATTHEAAAYYDA